MGFVFTFGPVSLKDKILALINSRTLAFKAKQPSRSRPAAPLWNAQCLCGLCQAGGGVGGGFLYPRGVMSPRCIKEGYN